MIEVYGTSGRGPVRAVWVFTHLGDPGRFYVEAPDGRVDRDDSGYTHADAARHLFRINHPPEWVVREVARQVEEGL